MYIYPTFHDCLGCLSFPFCVRIAIGSRIETEMRRARYNDNENRAINFHTSFPIVSTIYELRFTQFAQFDVTAASAE